MKIFYNIVLAAYLSGESNKHKIAYLEKLDQYLNHFGFKLILVDISGNQIDTKCATFRLSAVDFSDKIKRSTLLKSQEIQEAVMMEAELHGWDLDISAQKLLPQTILLRDFLINIKANLCILWNQFTGFNKIMSKFCLDIKLPYLYTHLGLLPGTIVFEAGGQMGESWVTLERDTFRKLPVNETELDIAKKYLKIIKQKKSSRKPQTKGWSIKDRINYHRERGRRIIFFAGNNDYRSGMLPVWAKTARYHSPIFTHTRDALQHLARLAKKHNWVIFFKPHPNIENSFNTPVSFNSNCIETVTGANIFECIKESDITVTIVSQVSYLSLIHGHPVLMLGNNQLTGKGCAYESHSIHDISDQIQKALKDGFSASQKKQWEIHVAQLIKYYLFSFDDPTAELIERDVDDASRFLMLQCKSPATGNNNQTRKNKLKKMIPYFIRRFMADDQNIYRNVH